MRCLALFLLLTIALLAWSPLAMSQTPLLVFNYRCLPPTDRGCR